MEMTWEIKGNELFIGVKGKLDTLSAMNLDDKMNELPEEVTSIYFDFEGLEYISSAGLRILYWVIEYVEEKGGNTSVKNVSDSVLEVFEVTGFKNMIKIE
ncbi:MAG: STAS domain-containing protein [Lachnospiraceae bacterium]|nr:STAS domain-containing protein [Lachnospiraceae bacterium]MDN4742853.1 STAS domain-containing protein [Lachnospiraceae bacterium C1.1]